MQTTSATYTPYPDARWSDLKVSFRLVDTTAAADGTAAANECESISQLAQTHDETEGMTCKFATFETNGWPLDGTYKLIPDDVSSYQTGWWSVISGADGTFATDPVLTFAFTSDHSSAGFTVIFDDKASWYPKAFTLAAYNSSDVLIDSVNVSCTSARQVVNLDVSNYRKVVLTFTETQEAYQRVRVSEVIFGIVQYFDKSNITNGTLTYEISPTAENLPTNELTITIDNSDNKYNLISPSSIYAYLQQGQPLDAEMGVGDSADSLEYVKAGRFYFAKAEAKDASMTAKITAYDRLYQLDKSICRIGITGTWTVSDAVAAVIADSGLTITTSIPSAVGAITINKCLPSDCTHREALRLIAQAAMATCYFDRDDTLIFVEMAADTSAETLDNDKMSSVLEVDVKDYVNSVILTVSDEYAETEATYTASDIGSGETAQTLSVDNPLVAAANGNTVAAWLLAMAQNRLTYNISDRGNPARELSDTITVYDAYSVNGDCVVVQQNLKYDGTLTASAKGWA